MSCFSLAAHGRCLEKIELPALNPEFYLMEFGTLSQFVLEEADLTRLKFGCVLLARCGFAQYLPCVLLPRFGLLLQ